MHTKPTLLATAFLLMPLFVVAGSKTKPGSSPSLNGLAPFLGTWYHMYSDALATMTISAEHEKCKIVFSLMPFSNVNKAKHVIIKSIHLEKDGLSFSRFFDSGKHVSEKAEVFGSELRTTESDTGSDYSVWSRAYDQSELDRRVQETEAQKPTKRPSAWGSLLRAALEVAPDAIAQADANRVAAKQAAAQQAAAEQAAAQRAAMQQAELQRQQQVAQAAEQRRMQALQEQLALAAEQNRIRAQQTAEARQEQALLRQQAVQAQEQQALAAQSQLLQKEQAALAAQQAAPSRSPQQQPVRVLTVQPNGNTQSPVRALRPDDLAETQFTFDNSQGTFVGYCTVQYTITNKFPGAVYFIAIIDLNDRGVNQIHKEYSDVIGPSTSRTYTKSDLNCVPPDQGIDLDTSGNFRFGNIHQ